MTPPRFLSFKLVLFACLSPVLLLDLLTAQPVVSPTPAARRLEVLFFGAPKNPSHDPIARYRTIKRTLGIEGINFTYSEDPAEAMNPANLTKYDAALMYGNWLQKGKMPEDQLKALTSYVENGGGFLPIHCASACYGGSDEFVSLVGGRFKKHGTGVFRVTNVNKNHPIMQSYEGFEAWDETYEHDQLNKDQEILEKREQEPWTWVRQQGKGRVFYTAAGHDNRVWDQPQFQNLIKRAIYWSVGPDKYRLLQGIKLPKPKQEQVELPGYVKREMITSAQEPLPPVDSIKMAQVPPGFELSLFASEPDILNPIFVNWDEKGRAYIIQTVDYPNNLHEGKLGNDKIIIAEDTNKDGRADKYTTFADKLSIPTSLTFANGGVICTNASEILFLKDTDGDGKADIRQVLFTGFSVKDTHAGVSNLVYAPDGWIYATLGYAGFKGTVGGEQFSFNQSVFRFKPDGSKLEEIQRTTNNTWGLGINSDFDLMGSTANGNPSFYVTFPKAAYMAANIEQSRTPRADDNPIINPSSTDIRQVDQHERYTAGAGHAFYTSKRFPESWRETTAFVCEPTGKLVGTFDITQNGAGFKANQRYNNLYNSADAWSGPVAAITGPDGAVWVCDWYNLIIQHNPTPNKNSSGMDAKNGKGNAYESPLRKDQMGRVYRIYPKGTTDDVNPKLDSTKPETLIAALTHPNLLWRLHAQRLLVERGKTDVVPALVAKSQTSAEAVWALAGLKALTPEVVAQALASPVRAIQRAGIFTATPEQIKAAYVATGKLIDLKPRELADSLVVLSGGTQDAATSAMIAQVQSKLGDDGTLKDAWQIATNRLANAASGAAPVVKVEKTRKFEIDPIVHERGSEVYSVTCIACHQPDAKGMAGAFPPLDGSEWVVGDPSVPARVVMNGLVGPVTVAGQTFTSAMPPHADLTDQQVADVLTYIRQSWSNDASPVSEADVKAERAKNTGRTTPWTAAELGH